MFVGDIACPCSRGIIRLPLLAWNLSVPHQSQVQKQREKRRKEKEKKKSLAIPPTAMLR